VTRVTAKRGPQTVVFTKGVITVLGAGNPEAAYLAIAKNGWTAKNLVRATPEYRKVVTLAVTPLTLAETASVFGEMLTFRKLLDQAKTKAERKTLLAGKVEDMINTVVRQIAFYDFECKLHAARRDGELTPEGINALWMSVQAESLGPVFEFMEGYETFWSYIPHFIHSPFYVYAYAFGDGLVNALYAVYTDGLPGFEDKYFEMLKAGGSKHHKDLLAPFGLDASDPKFWDRGLSMIAGFIDELEAMEG
jgi:oligoendopeptidase F